MIGAEIWKAIGEEIPEPRAFRSLSNSDFAKQLGFRDTDEFADFFGSLSTEKLGAVVEFMVRGPEHGNLDLYDVQFARQVIGGWIPKVLATPTLEPGRCRKVGPVEVRNLFDDNGVAPQTRMTLLPTGVVQSSKLAEALEHLGSSYTRLTVFRPHTRAPLVLAG